MLPGGQEDCFEVWFFRNLNHNPDFPEFGSLDQKKFLSGKKFYIFKDQLKLLSKRNNK